MANQEMIMEDNKEVTPVVEETVSPTAEEFVFEDPTEAPVSGPEEVYLPPMPTASDRNRRLSDAVRIASRDSALGIDPEQAFTALLDDFQYDPDDLDTPALASVGMVIDQATGAVLEKGEEGRAQLEDSKAALKTIAEESDDEMRNARAYVVSLPTYSQLTDRDREEAVWQAYVNRMTAKVWDDVGINTQTLGDVAGLMVPQENLRMAAVADAIGANYGALDYVSFTDFYESISTHVATLPIDQRQKVVETVMEAWPEIHGDNRILLASFLQEGILGDYNTSVKAVENWMERAEQSTIGAAVMKRGGRILYGLTKAGSALRLASKANNVEAMADIITEGVKGTLKGAGVDPLDAVASLDPSKDIATLVKGADNSKIKEVTNIQKDLDIYLDAVDQVDTFGLGLSEAEQLAVITRRQRVLEESEEFSNVSVTQHSDLDYSISYTKKGADGESTQLTEFAAYQVDDLGGYVYKGEGDGYSSINFKVTSPMYRFIDDKRTLVQLPEQMQFQGAKIKGLYDAAIKSALKPLGSKEMQRLDQVLISGDEWLDDLGKNAGKVFSKEELVDHGVNGVRLSEKEFQAYEDVRKVIDHMYTVKDREIVNKRKAHGWKTTEWEDGLEVPTRTYSSAQDALTAFRQSPAKSHWIGVKGDDTPQGIRTYSSADEVDIHTLQIMYDNGYQLGRAKDGVFRKNGVSLEWGFVKADEVMELRSGALNRRPGYIPRVRKDAFYFVKEIGDETIGGTVIKGGKSKTVRYFDNHADAETFAKGLDTGGEGKFVVRADRELTSAEFDSEMINLSGGLITGARASEPIPFGLNGVKGTREGSLEGLQRYVNHLSSNIPMSLYREGLQQRWIDHAKSLGALPKDYLGGFREAVAHLKEGVTSLKFLDDTHNQISFLSGIRTRKEAEMLNTQRAIARVLESKGRFGKALARRLIGIGPEAYAGTIRGITFHLMLGSWNPAQFAIQASGALVAMTINPVQGAKAVGQMMGYAIADLVTANPAKRAAFIKHLRSKGMDMDGYEMWEKSGLRESITHANIDYKSVWNDTPYDAGVIRKLLSTNTMFFKSGELVNARVSFATAFNEWRAVAKNATRTPNASDMKDILARTEIFRLNMSKVNSTDYQKGMLSVPTQFMQVNTKFLEKVLGKGQLTSKEKAMLIAGQAALYGAAGVPLGKAVVPHMLNMVNQLLPEESQINAINTDPATLNKIYTGLFGSFIHDYMGVENVLVNRVALGNDFIEGIFGFMTGNVELLPKLMGPFHSIYEAANDGVTRSWTAMSTILTSDDVTLDDMVMVTKVLGASLANMPSTTRNLMKARDMTDSQFFKNKDGKSISHYGDLNSQTIIGQALGFSSTQVADWHELNSRHKNTEPRSTHSTEAKRILRFLTDMNTLGVDEDTQRYNAMAVNAIMSKYSQAEDRVKIIDQVKLLLKDPNDPDGKLLKGILQNWHSEMQEGLNELHNHIVLKSSPALARKLQRSGAEIPAEALKKTTAPYEKVQY